jgi:predicted nucleic acid-binding protein
MKRIKLPDAIIAATALVQNCILLSHNTTDFNKIEGLQVLDPYSFVGK